MSDSDSIPEGLEMTRNCVRHEDRSVAAAGAADGNRDVGLPFLLVLGNQEIQKALQTLKKLPGFRLAFMYSMTAGSLPVWAFRCGTKWGFGRKRTSNTRSERWARRT